MAAPEVLQYPDPILTQRAEPVLLEQGVEIVGKLRAALAATRYGSKLGMAAPQIGEPYRVFVAEDRAYINPVIKWVPKGGEKTMFEGCYSTGPDMYRVTRPYACVVTWYDEDGQEHEEKFTQVRARVILHEFDHLEGKLCNGQEAE